MACYEYTTHHPKPCHCELANMHLYTLYLLP